MKAITLWQPWASLVAWRLKRFETRSWQTNYRGAIAIHAAKRKPEGWWMKLGGELREVGRLDEIRCSVEELPRGAIVAVAELVHCDRMTVASIQKQTSLEREMGFWQPGRFAWDLAKVRPLVKPVFCGGQQGLWDVPPDVLKQVEGAMSGEKGEQMRLFESVRC